MGDNKEGEYNKRILVTGHRNIKSSLHRFRNIEAPDCPCGIVQEERERLIAAVAKTTNCPIKKDTLIKRHYKAFARFTKTMD